MGSEPGIGDLLPAYINHAEHGGSRHGQLKKKQQV